MSPLSGKSLPVKTGHWCEYVGQVCVHCGAVSTAPLVYKPLPMPTGEKRL